MFNFSALPIITAREFSPQKMIRLSRVSRQFYKVMHSDDLWRPYVPESIRYQSNLFLRYSALMQSDKVTPLIKFLVHKKGMTYDQAVCVRIHDERVVQKIISEEITLNEAQQIMTLSISLRRHVLDNKLTLDAALKLNTPTKERFYHESGFADEVESSSILFCLLNNPCGLQMLLEGLLNPRECNSWRYNFELVQDFMENPYVLIVLREGLITGTQLLQICRQVIFTEEMLQAIRMGYITAQDIMAYYNYDSTLDYLKGRIKSISANYFDQAGPSLIVWLKEHPDFALHARTLFNHHNGWNLYSQKILTLDYLLKMPSVEFLKCLIESEEVVKALLSKKITLDYLLILQTVNRLEVLTWTYRGDDGAYWLNKIIDRTITATMLASIECSQDQIDKLRWPFVSLLERCGKTLADLLRDANCELDQLLSLDINQLDGERKQITPECDNSRFEDPAEYSNSNLELPLLMYEYKAQAIRNLTCNMKRHSRLP